MTATREIAYNVRRLNRRWQRMLDMNVAGHGETHRVMLDIQLAHPWAFALTDNDLGHVKRRFHYMLTTRKPGDYAWTSEMRRQGWMADAPTILSTA